MASDLDRATRVARTAASAGAPPPPAGGVARAMVQHNMVVGAERQHAVKCGVIPHVTTEFGHSFGSNFLIRSHSQTPHVRVAAGLGCDFGLSSTTCSRTWESPVRAQATVANPALKLHQMPHISPQGLDRDPANVSMKGQLAPDAARRCPSTPARRLPVSRQRESARRTPEAASPKGTKTLDTHGARLSRDCARAVAGTPGVVSRGLPEPAPEVPSAGREVESPRAAKPKASEVCVVERCGSFVTDATQLGSDLEQTMTAISSVGNCRLPCPVFGSFSAAHMVEQGQTAMPAPPSLDQGEVEGRLAAICAAAGMPKPGHLRCTPSCLPGAVRSSEGVVHLSADTVHGLLSKKLCILVDLRGEDRAAGLIPGALHVPAIGQVPFPVRIPELVVQWEAEEVVVFTCQYSAHRAPTCANWYREKADPEQIVAILSGGFRGWDAANLPVQDLMVGEGRCDVDQLALELGSSICETASVRPEGALPLTLNIESTDCAASGLSATQCEEPNRATTVVTTSRVLTDTVEQSAEQGEPIFGATDAPTNSKRQEEVHFSSGQGDGEDLSQARVLNGTDSSPEAQIAALCAVASVPWPDRPASTPYVAGTVETAEGVIHLSAETVHGLLSKKYCVLVDLRGDDRASGLMAGAIHIPAIDDVPFPVKVPELVMRWKAERIVVFTCQYSAHRAPTCANWYREQADQRQIVAVLSGGFRGWEAANLPVDDSTMGESRHDADRLAIELGNIICEASSSADCQQELPHSMPKATGQNSEKTVFKGDAQQSVERAKTILGGMTASQQQLQVLLGSAGPHAEVDRSAAGHEANELLATIGMQQATPKAQIAARLKNNRNGPTLRGKADQPAKKLGRCPAQIKNLENLQPRSGSGARTAPRRQGP